MPGPLVPFALSLVVVGVVAEAAARFGLLPDWVRVTGPLVTVHTDRGKALVDRVANASPRFWRAWGTLGVAITAVLGTALFVLVAFAGYASIASPLAGPVTAPQNALVIPGVNDFLPLSVAPELVTALVLALAVHEGAHGLLCRVGGIDIDSVGVFFVGLLPFGAFVDPDDRTADAAPADVLGRVFAAGIVTNLAVALLAFGLLFGPVTAAIAPAAGVAVGGVVEHSPAATAGVEGGERITAVGNTTVDSPAALDRSLDESVDRSVDRAGGSTGSCAVSIEIDGERRVTVDRRVTVVAGADRAPAALPAGTTIAAVDDRPVCTVDGFDDAVGSAEQATLVTDAGRRLTLPVGATVVPGAGGPFAAAGAPANGTVTVVRFGGERVRTTAALLAALDETEPGDRVPVVAYVDGARRTFAVTLGGNGGDDGSDAGFLGARPVAGTSGLVLEDVGVEPYPADELLAAFGGQTPIRTGLVPEPIDAVVSTAFVVVLLPLAGAVGLSSYNFAGFEGGVSSFYAATGSDPVVFAVANVLYWLGWVNLQLAVFNAIPAYPLDGGRVLHTAATALRDRVGVDWLPTAVTALVTAVMLGSLLVMLVAPQL